MLVIMYRTIAYADFLLMSKRERHLEKPCGRASKGVRILQSVQEQGT